MLTANQFVPLPALRVDEREDLRKSHQQAIIGWSILALLIGAAIGYTIGSPG